MQIDTKYSIGQTVHAITSDFCTRKIKCPACHGSGMVPIDGESFCCPKCKGHGLFDRHAGHKWVPTETGVVGNVQVTVTAARFLDTWDKPSPHITYMLDTTGVGSGRLWEESDTFPSREDAQAECDRRNADKNFTDEALTPGADRGGA